MPVTMDVRISGVDRIRKGFSNVTSGYRGGAPSKRIAAVIVASTEQRILFEKQTPDGDDWKPWSDAYAETRTSEHSLLIDEGDLSKSISANVKGATIEVGSNLIYAAVQNDERQFLGLSKEDDNAIADEMGEWLKDVL